MIAQQTKQEETYLRLVSTIYYLGGGMRDHTKGFGEAHCPACTYGDRVRVKLLRWRGYFPFLLTTFPVYLPLANYHLPAASQRQDVDQETRREAELRPPSEPEGLKLATWW